MQTEGSVPSQSQSQSVSVSQPQRGHVTRSTSKGKREFRSSPVKRERRDTDSKRKEVTTPRPQSQPWQLSQSQSPVWTVSEDCTGPFSVICEEKQLGTKPMARNSHVAGIFNGQMIVRIYWTQPGQLSDGQKIFGGVHHSQKLNDVQIFDIEVKCKGDRPEGRYCHTGVMVQDKFVVFGGLGDQARFSDVYSLDLESMIWKRLETEDPPEGRSHHCAAAYGDKMIIFGGLADTGKRLNDVHILDLVSLKWFPVLTKEEPPIFRLAAGMTLWQNKLVIIGGYTGGRRLNDVYILDLGTQSWTQPITVGTPPDPRFGHSLTLLANKLIVYGGSGEEKKSLNVIYFLDLETMKWHSLGTTSIGHEAYHSVCVSPENNLYIYGSTESSYNNDIYLLNTSKIEALRETPFEEAKTLIRSHTKTIRELISSGNSSLSVEALCIHPTFQTYKQGHSERLILESLNLLQSQFKRLIKEEHQLEIGYESLREECELYERSKLKLNKYNQDIPHRIKLNVGGVKSEPESMLAAMFSGRYPYNTDDEGCVFIDRNGKYFEYILDYLRSGNIYLPDERVFLMNLRTEAEYYQLMGLRRIIDRSLGWGRGREEEDKTKRNQEEQ